MASSYGREIVLGVGGGISAYKSAELLRRLQDCGYSITVVPTRSSLNFVGSATWEALSGKEVSEDLWNRVHEVPHISLAKSANAVVIAPATANLLAKIAQGIADDLLTNIVLASTAPLIVVPAMHTEMWLNPAVQHNVKILRARGALVIEPDSGRLTGPDSGVGRYPEIPRIIAELNDFLGRSMTARGKRVLISAGGTREPIDSVRYIGNLSSGKQGVALALAAAARGAEVTVVAAHTDPRMIPQLVGIKVIEVGTALQMQEVLKTEFANCDLLFMTAAVADARPISSETGKIEKSDLHQIALVENPDILQALSQNKRVDQVLVGFAAQAGQESAEDEERALVKMRKKNLDFLYLNNIRKTEIFGSEETEGIIFTQGGQKKAFSRASKLTLAENLLDLALDKLG